PYTTLFRSSNQLYCHQYAIPLFIKNLFFYSSSPILPNILIFRYILQIFFSDSELFFRNGFCIYIFAFNISVFFCPYYIQYSIYSRFVLIFLQQWELLNEYRKEVFSLRKQLLLSFVATFLLFVPGAFAHTHLVSTNPAEGETVDENIKNIDLTYEGKIEEGSIFKVLASDGKEMEIHSISINNGVLSGIMLDPLPNDTYTVEWDSISEDGHPLSGSYSLQ